MYLGRAHVTHTKWQLTRESATKKQNTLQLLVWVFAASVWRQLCLVFQLLASLTFKFFLTVTLVYRPYKKVVIQSLILNFFLVQSWTASRMLRLKWTLMNKRHLREFCRRCPYEWATFLKLRLWVNNSVIMGGEPEIRRLLIQQEGDTVAMPIIVRVPGRFSILATWRDSGSGPWFNNIFLVERVKKLINGIVFCRKQWMLKHGNNNGIKEIIS